MYFFTASYQISPPSSHTVYPFSPYNGDNGSRKILKKVNGADMKPVNLLVGVVSAVLCVFCFVTLMMNCCVGDCDTLTNLFTSVGSVAFAVPAADGFYKLFLAVRNEK